MRSPAPKALVETAVGRQPAESDVPAVQVLLKPHVPHPQIPAGPAGQRPLPPGRRPPRPTLNDALPRQKVVEAADRCRIAIPGRLTDRLLSLVEPPPPEVLDVSLGSRRQVEPSGLQEPQQHRTTTSTTQRRKRPTVAADSLIRFTG
ncbi:hypothetical protein Psuf_066100 [Phytohabitans suffuscus]|uniref:Uncharacterized protein n=1 Tax=Phytohabitans suffuscus TaxID=624315 RepID=A0A6F8YT36_9ACTN|nr:hypothetical protein Psuf_066100 [Phytohabitans suffuscus]